MTGPEHYREAERLVSYVKESENAPQACALLLAEAQVHATLAQVAATAELDAFGEGVGTGRTLKRSRAWEAVLDREASA